MVKCPYCGYEANLNEFKLLRNPWKYGVFTVRRLECPKCHKIFHHYFGITSAGKEVMFSIKIKPRT